MKNPLQDRVSGPFKFHLKGPIDKARLCLADAKRALKARVNNEGLTKLNPNLRVYTHACARSNACVGRPGRSPVPERTPQSIRA